MCASWRLLGFKEQYAARPISACVPLGIVAVGHIETVVHQVCTAEQLALNGEWLYVDAVQLLHAIHLSGVKTCHVDTWQVLVLERFGLPPVEHCLIFGFGDIH